MKSSRRFCTVALARGLAGALRRVGVALISGMALGLQAQSITLPPNQPLALPYLLQSALASYPSLIASRFEARAASQDIVSVERQRWPVLSATVESNSGTTRSQPSRALQVEQTIWDFGRINARISEAQAIADSSLLKVYIQQQELFLQVVNAWQNMVGARERVLVAEQTTKRLRDYQAQMQRRVAAEASPRIDLELADARLLQIEVELTAAKTALKVALTRLEQLSGLEQLASRVDSVAAPPTLDETLGFLNQVRQTDLLALASEHPAVARARADLAQVRTRLEVKRSEAWPQVYLRATKPLGTIVTNSDTSLSTFIGLRYAPGAGFANLAEAQAAATRIEGAEQTVEAALREVLQTMENDREEFINARNRIGALEKAVNGADLVLESYKRQFEAGRKTWQDLLNAVRELGQNQSALADARASMIGAAHRLQIRMGMDVK